MKRGLTEVQLCEKYHNENPHTEHVTYLALRLFDRLTDIHKLNQADRRLLESACRLHDIGFMTDPGKHAMVGHRIILQEGLAGFKEKQKHVIASAILLHPRRYKRMTGMISIKKGPDGEKVFKIASMLRIADALDHAHLQDADISSVKVEKKTVTVDLTGVRYDGTLNWADDKADLFRKTFGIAIKFRHGVPGRLKASRYMDLVDKKDSVLKGARKILCFLFRSFCDHRRGVMDGSDIEHLHEMRVLIRRFVVAMKYFKPYWSSKAAKRLRKNADMFCDRLGKCRDLDVWTAFLARDGVRNIAKSTGGWLEYYAAQEEEREAAHREVVKLLESSLYSGFVQQSAYFIRVVIPGLMLVVPDDKYSEFTAAQVRKGYAVVTKKKYDFEKMSSKKMHEFRKLLRKLRYAVEFTVPVSSPQFLGLEKRLNVLTDLLGDIHDMDVHAVRLLGVKKSPKGLLRYIAAKKSRDLKKFTREWAEFCQPQTRRLLG